MVHEHFWQNVVGQSLMCPAMMKPLAADYPVRFGGKVPALVRLKTKVCADVSPLDPNTSFAGNVNRTHFAWTNVHGAVCIISSRTGERLGTKPDEFEVVSWWDHDAVKSNILASVKDNGGLLESLDTSAPSRLRDLLSFKAKVFLLTDLKLKV